MKKGIHIHLLYGGLFILAGFFGWGCSPTKKGNEKILPNGLCIITNGVPDSKVVSLLMMVRAGSIHETDSTQGLSRLVEKSLFLASQNYRDIQWEIDSYGGKYKSSINQDYVYFAVTVSRSYLAQVLDIFIDVIQHTQFPDSLVGITKSALLDNMKIELSNSRIILLKLFLEELFHQHPYRYLPIGNDQNVKRLQIRDIRKYYEDYYTPENIKLILTGGFDRQSVLTVLEKKLGSFNRPSNKTGAWAREPKQNSPREIVRTHSFSSNMAFMTVGWQAPSIQESNTYVLDVLMFTLGVGESSRLNMHIRDVMDSVYYVWAEYLTPREPGYFFINAVCNPGAVDEVKKRIFKEIEILRVDSITPKELQRAKMLLESQEAYALEGSFEMAFYIGFWTIMENVHFAESYLPHIRKVTIEDVQRFASDYLRDDNYSSVLLLPVR